MDGTFDKLHLEGPEAVDVIMADAQDLFFGSTSWISWSHRSDRLEVEPQTERFVDLGNLRNVQDLTKKSPANQRADLGEGTQFLFDEKFSASIRRSQEENQSPQQTRLATENQSRARHLNRLRFWVMMGCSSKMEKIPTSLMRFPETGPEPETVGVGAACGPLGIWALTFQERLSAFMISGFRLLVAIRFSLRMRTDCQTLKIFS